MADPRYQQLDLDRLTAEVPHPTDERKRVPLIKQVHLRSKCKACGLYLIRPGLLGAVNSWLASGVAHKLILGWIAYWQTAQDDLSDDDRDTLALTPNNLSTHRHHLDPEIEALRDLEYSRGLVEGAQKTGVPLSMASVRTAMALAHREFLSRDLSDVPTDQLLRAIPQLGRVDAHIEEHLWKQELSDAERTKLSLQWFRTKLKPDQLAQLQGWLAPTSEPVEEP